MSVQLVPCPVSGRCGKGKNHSPLKPQYEKCRAAATRDRASGKTVSVAPVMKKSESASIQTNSSRMESLIEFARDKIKYDRIGFDDLEELSHEADSNHGEWFEEVFAPSLSEKEKMRSNADDLIEYADRLDRTSATSTSPVASGKKGAVAHQRDIAQFRSQANDPYSSSEDRQRAIARTVSETLARHQGANADTQAGAVAEDLRAALWVTPDVSYYEKGSATSTAFREFIKGRDLTGDDAAERLARDLDEHGIAKEVYEDDPYAGLMYQP